MKRPLTLLLALAGLAPAAESPLGLVEQVEVGANQAKATVRFDAAASAHLAPGAMVALYGPGVIEKHPLTGEVIVTRPALLAKAQLGSLNGDRWQARILWTAANARLTPGMDAVPLPGEAAPNAAPVAGAVRPLAAPQGAAVVLSVPVSDPDGDPLAVSWSLEGPQGRTGTLLESSTSTPQTSWIAPQAAGEVTAVAVVTDPLGQSTTLRLPLTTTPPGEVRERSLKHWSVRGNGVEPGLTRLARGEDGTWFAITAAVGMTGSAGLARIVPGFAGSEALSFRPEAAPRKPLALAVRGGELHVLDASRGLVAVYGPDGAQRRTYGSFDKAVDLALGADGTAFIADAADRGVQVYEADGRYRCRLGRGTGDDAFQGIAAVAVAMDGTILAVDPLRPALVRFDRFGRRLEPWACPGDVKDPAIDVVVHPQRGVLVLLTSGKVVPVTATGLGEALADPATTAGIPAPGPAEALAVDASGTLISLRQGGILLRWNADLAPAGASGSSLRTGDAWAADGLGRTYALDRRSGTVAMFDAEGWQTARLQSGAKKAVDLAAAPSGRYLAVVDAKGYAAIRLDLATPTKPGTPLGQEGTYDGQFKEPAAATFDDQDRLYVLDTDLRRVSVFTAEGGFAFNIGGQAQLADPERLAASPAGDLVYVYDSDNYEIKRFTCDHSKRNAAPSGIGGGKGTGPGQLRSVVGLGCDRLGLLHVLDDSRDDLQLLDFRGQACQPLLQVSQADLGLTDLAALAVHPDGPVIIAGSGRVVGWRW